MSSPPPSGYSRSPTKTSVLTQSIRYSSPSEIPGHPVPNPEPPGSSFLTPSFSSTAFSYMFPFELESSSSASLTQPPIASLYDHSPLLAFTSTLAQQQQQEYLDAFFDSRLGGMGASTTSTPAATPIVPTPFTQMSMSMGMISPQLFLLQNQFPTIMPSFNATFPPALQNDDDLNITFLPTESKPPLVPLRSQSLTDFNTKPSTSASRSSSTSNAPISSVSKYQHPPRHRQYMADVSEQLPSLVRTVTTTPHLTTSPTQQSSNKSYQRIPIPREQKLRLKQLFAQDPYPKPARMAEIAQELGLEKLKVRIWYQNQRSSLKRNSGTE
ncbi:hypothetical protein BCR33DRAFT_733559 [Rhizoclosmatium globosum]|uniref:Homeobox domain-containing protein n=1 Tax=Rhizoclosmatium globosum TaxID=329046 RepID=A0A1Y2CYG3_9FUNG|nr:hypothetical protein BCR33DRAFT_733559 [Rhizoclosmatium globosum]|eukprot:ORY52048.1 hypothetical protein BCR33DRAFT_733559 [Rhizoclosmatium globosum]